MSRKANHLPSPSLKARAAKRIPSGFDPYHIAVKNSDEVFLLVDTSYTILITNATQHPRAQAFLGFKIQSGANVLSLVPKEQRAALKELYEKIFAGQQFVVEKNITAGGFTTYHRIKYKPAYDDAGALAGALVTVDDITEIKNKKLNLQLSEERWRFALEGSHQGMWDWDIKTGKVYFSQIWKKMFGFTDEDGIQHISHWKQRVHPQDQKIVEVNLKQHLESNDPLFESIYRFRAKNGEYRWLLSRGKIINKNKEGIARRMIGTHTDITHIRLLEENYKTLFDANPLPSWTYHLEKDRFVAVNKAALHLYGYSLEDFLNSSMACLLPEGTPWQKGNKTFFKGGRRQQHRTKNGELITVNLTSHILHHDKGSIALVLAEDVTEKAAAEQVVFLSNERFKLASKATSDVIYDWDITTGQVNWGEGLHTLFGYRQNEFSLLDWEAGIHPDERENVLQSIYEAVNNPRKKTWKKEYRFRKAKGDYRYVIEKGFIVRGKNKKAVRMIGAIQDITDIKQKQVALQKSNERFDTVLKATSEFIWDWNLEDNTFYRDPYGLKKVLGVMKENGIANEKEWIKRLHPDDQPGAFALLENIRNGNIGQSFESEYRFKKDDGNYAFIHDRGIVISNGEGKPVRLIGAAKDVTLRKKLEQELLQKELEKQKIISKATIDTQEQERSEIGRELHDNVNQVLTTTKLFLELALMRPELKEEMIRKSSESIVYVINEIRQLSRSLMNPSIGDLGLLYAINDLVENINATKKLQVKLEAAPAMEALLTPDLKLTVYRILQEALNNAIKHSKASTVLITIKKKEKNIELMVHDDGIGFNIASIKKGIGLKNIENRVYLINGQLQVKSAPEEGCTISVYFPFKKTETDPK